MPEIPIKEQRCFSPDEMRQIVNTATRKWKVLFATLASTAMRCGEAFGLHAEDVDLNGGRIFVRGSVWNGQEVTVKTKKGYRVVNIESALVEMLAAHLSDRTTGRVFQTPHWYTVLQEQRETQAQSDSATLESAVWRAARLPSWPRFAPADERSAGS